MGRPSKYNPKLGDEICERLAEGESLLRMCRDDHLPHSRVVRRWVLGQGIPEAHAEDFRSNYNEARLAYEDCVFEELDEVARRATQSDVARATLWSSNSKWSLARMNRAKFGDRHDLGLHGTPGEPPVTTSSVNVNLASLNPKQQASLRELARLAIEGAEE